MKISLSHYSPFGSCIQELQYAYADAGDTSKYRFEFNNQEQDKELGEYYAFEYRMHDSRLGRFLSVDPLKDKYPWNSTYAFAENRVIDGIDLEGLEYYYYGNGRLYTHKTKFVVSNAPVPLSVSNKLRIAYNFNTINSGIKFNYKDFHNGTLMEKNLILRNIYQKEIGPLNKQTVLLANENSSYYGVQTGSLSKDKKEMNIYTNSIWNGEYLMDNYFNLINTMYHESLHFKYGSDGFSHFQIFKLETTHFSYLKTTANFKDYLLSIAKDYIEIHEYIGLKSFLTIKNGKWTYKSQKDKENFNDFYNVYIKDVQYYNSISKDKISVKSKKDFFE